MYITSKYIDAFLSMAKTLNFSETAAELHLTQPTVSRMIRMLEKELGCKLFNRDTRHCDLTDAGAFWHKKFSRIQQMIADGMKEGKK